MNLNLSFHRSGAILPQIYYRKEYVSVTSSPTDILIGKLSSHAYKNIICYLLMRMAVFRKYEPKRRSIGIVGASTMFIAIKRFRSVEYGYSGIG
ncbi:Uncharacterised protein [Neisseria gonorrhoeae]|uniref:Uncharacterized protein n=1 Tax=Neisseria gonorrhoeae TaxID=485 RepID=A0A378VWH5_NEIGO|nr:Uncharacterised protein [Neisseria gonorrhoeae]